MSSSEAGPETARCPVRRIRLDDRPDSASTGQNMTPRTRPAFAIVASDRHPLTGTLSLKLYDYAEHSAQAYLLASPEQGMRVTESRPGHAPAPGYHLPYAIIGAPARTAAAAHGLRDYLSRLPPQAVQAARDVGHAQYPCLVLMSRFEEARQLWRTCPPLLWFLGERLGSAQVCDQEIIRLLRLPLKGLFRELFPGIETRGLTILRRIKGMRYALEDARIVRQFLRSQDFLERGAHVPVFAWSRLREVGAAICSDRVLMQSVVFRKSLENELEPQTSDPFHRLVEYLKDCVRMGRQLDIRHPEQAVCACATVEQAGRLHDRWRRRMNEREALATLGGKNEEFPPPPLPGTDDIIPIRTAMELLLEGIEMHHCVYGHLPEIQAGEAYVYKVLSSERAPLMIARSRHGGYRIEELRLACNAEPSQGTVRVVERWTHSEQEITKL